MPTTEKGRMEEQDHDLLVRVDEKLDSQTRILDELVELVKARGEDISELKTENLLHKQKTALQDKEHLELKDEVTKLKDKVTLVSQRVTVVENASVVLWTQKYPKLAWVVFVSVLIMINFHDYFVPWLLGLLGYKSPP